MKSKLTLRLEEELIKRAKKYAQERGTSVSQIVAEYFALIEEDKPTQDSEMPPLTSSLCGILKDVDISKTDYKDHLEEKYLK